LNQNPDRSRDLAAELMAETESVADDDLPSTSLRKGPASETAEPIAEPAVTEHGH